MMKIIFAGTPQFALPFLDALMYAGHAICAVLTQPDKQAGRGRKLSESPVKAFALMSGLPLYQPTTLRDEAIQTELAQFNADVMVDVAFGLLIPPAILKMFPFGCINVHPSLLPRWRGASPIQSAILSGDKETGVTIMQMDRGLDTGPILLQEKCSIEEGETSGELEKRLSELGRKLLLQALKGLEIGDLQASVQDDALTCYAKKIEKADAKIDWQKQAIQIYREILAFNPWPISYTNIGDQTVRVWKAEVIDGFSDEKPGTIVRIHREGIDVTTGQGILRLLCLQFPGGKPLDILAVLNSKKDFFSQYGHFE